MEKNAKKLVDTMLEHATVFLSDATEFYPFGGVVNTKGDVVPLAAYTGKEFPKSSEVITLLETAIAEKFRKNEIQIAAITVDTSFQETSSSEVAQAIRVTLMTSQTLYSQHYFPYRINAGKVDVYDYVVYNGSNSNY